MLELLKGFNYYYYFFFRNYLESVNKYKIIIPHVENYVFLYMETSGDNILILLASFVLSLSHEFASVLYKIISVTGISIFLLR